MFADEQEGSGKENRQKEEAKRIGQEIENCLELQSFLLREIQKR